MAYDCAGPLAAAEHSLRDGNQATPWARDVVARQDLPHYASSAMDGWAISGGGHGLGRGRAAPFCRGEPVS